MWKLWVQMIWRENLCALSVLTTVVYELYFVIGRLSYSELLSCARTTIDDFLGVHLMPSDMVDCHLDILVKIVE